MQRAAWRAGMLGAINTLAVVLSVRFMSLVAIVGGIVLTWLCLQTSDPFKLIALAIYCLGTSLMIWLTFGRK